jgi:hypothetical protein
MSYSRRQLYALGEPLGESATYRRADGGLVLGGGGGGSAPAQSSTQVQDLPEWVKPYAKDVLSKGQALTQQDYTPYGGQRVAGLSDLQKTAMGTVASPEAFGKSVQGYMSPYMQNVVQAQQRSAIQQGGADAATLAARGAMTGGFGGSGTALQGAMQNRNLAQQLSDIQAMGSQNAYQQAVGQANTALGQQMQLGGVQQAQEQRGLDVGYQDFLAQKNYPYQQLSYMANLVRGTPMGMNTQSQVYQGPGNLAAQLGGLGMMGYGLTKAAGGEIKGYAEGGLSVMDKFNNPDAMMSEMSDLSIDQLQRIIQNPSTPAEGKAAQEMLATKQAQEAAMQASEQRGLASAWEQVPYIQRANIVRAAGGGILAFSGDDTDQEGGGSYVPTSSYSEQMGKLFGLIPTAFKHLVSAPGYGFSDTDTSGQAVKTPEDVTAQALKEAANKPPTRLSDYQKPPTKSAGAKTGAKSTGVTATPKDVDQTQNAQNTFLSDLAAAKQALTDPQDAIDRKAVNDLLAKQLGRPEEIRQQRMNDFLMQFGAGLVQGGSQPGVGRGLSGLLRSAGTAAPAGIQALMENRKLAQAAQDNAMKMQLENYRYNIADRKNDKQSMLNAAQNMRMLQMQQAQLDETKRRNLATEKLMGQRIAAGNTSLENAMLRSKAAIAQSSMKQAAKDWNDPLNGPALRKQYPSQGAYQQELFNQQWGQTMPQLSYLGTLGGGEDLGG